MHYRNGREAKNGDKVVQFGMDNTKVVAAGTLVEAVATGGDFCNGKVVAVPAYGAPSASNACLCDCLHEDDLAAILVEKGLDKRPAPKTSG